MSWWRTLLEGPLPPSVRYCGIPVAGLFLVMLFVFLGFPYDDLAHPLGQRLSAATGADVYIGGIDPRITIAGPGISARDVVVRMPGQPELAMDPLRVRPAWSTSWLRGQPAIHVDLESTSGRAEGTLRLATAPGWSGEVHEVDLALLPLPLPDGVSLSGVLAADADVVMSEDGTPAGSVVFQAREGSISHPLLPIDLDFTELTGDVVLGGERLAEIRSLELDGEALAASVQGSVRRGKRPGHQPLDLRLQVEVKNPGMATMLRGMGVDLDPDGRTRVRLGGTLQNPRPL